MEKEKMTYSFSQNSNKYLKSNDFLYMCGGIVKTLSLITQTQKILTAITNGRFRWWFL